MGITGWDELTRLKIVILILFFMIAVLAYSWFKTLPEAGIYEKNKGWFDLAVNGTLKLVPAQDLCEQVGYNSNYFGNYSNTSRQGVNESQACATWGGCS